MGRKSPKARKRRGKVREVRTSPAEVLTLLMRGLHACLRPDSALVRHPLQDVLDRVAISPRFVQDFVARLDVGQGPGSTGPSLPGRVAMAPVVALNRRTPIHENLVRAGGLSGDILLFVDRHEDMNAACLYAAILSRWAALVQVAGGMEEAPNGMEHLSLPQGVFGTPTGGKIIPVPRFSTENRLGFIAQHSDYSLHPLRTDLPGERGLASTMTQARKRASQLIPEVLTAQVYEVPTERAVGRISVIADELQRLFLQGTPAGEAEEEEGWLSDFSLGQAEPGKNDNALRRFADLCRGRYSIAGFGLMTTLGVVPPSGTEDSLKKMMALESPLNPSGMLRNLSFPRLPFASCLICPGEPISVHLPLMTGTTEGRVDCFHSQVAPISHMIAMASVTPYLTPPRLEQGGAAWAGGYPTHTGVCFLGAYLSRDREAAYLLFAKKRFDEISPTLIVSTICEGGRWNMWACGGWGLLVAELAEAIYSERRFLASSKKRKKGPRRRGGGESPQGSPVVRVQLTRRAYRPSGRTPPSRPLSHQRTVPEHEVVYKRFGTKPIDVEEFLSLQKRGYAVYSSVEQISEADRARMRSRRIPLPGEDTWLALKTIIRREAVHKPGLPVDPRRRIRVVTTEDREDER